MKGIFFLSIQFLLCHCAYSQGINTVLQERIDSLFTVDQQVQMDMVLASRSGVAKRVMDSLELIEQSTFKRHIPLLDQMINQYGLPTYSLVGKQSSDNFLTLVNHSFTDPGLQQRVARLAKHEVSRNNISGPALATMVDKMLIKSGRKQLYGTQCNYDASGNAVAVNLQRPHSVDKRRKKMGMKPLSDYLSMMTDLHQQMNQLNIK